MGMFDLFRKITDVVRETGFSATPITHIVLAQYVNVVNYIDKYNKKCQKYEELKMDDNCLMSGYEKTLHIGVNSHDETNLLAAAIYVKNRQVKDFLLQEEVKNKEEESFFFILPKNIVGVTNEVPSESTETWGFLSSEDTIKNFVNNHVLNLKYNMVKKT